MEPRKRTSSRRRSAPRILGPPARRNEAALEIQAGGVSDTAIQGLVNDWIVPMFVDRIIESGMGCNISANPPAFRGNYEYNNFGRTAADDKKPESRTATETRSAEANAEAATDVDGRGA